MNALEQISRNVVACNRCTRLVECRSRAAVDPPARFRDSAYWARPVPGFGDPGARLVVVGLAPAAHGANRTGRMFTGDRSGEWLFRGLHRAGFADRAESVARDDGLRLMDCYVTAVVRCAPPGNRPTPAERDECAKYLSRELLALPRARVILALGAFAWGGALRVLESLGVSVSPKPKFAHGAEVAVGPWVMVGSYHPSQQNTFTGRLTESMFDDAIAAAARRMGEA